MSAAPLQPLTSDKPKGVWAGYTKEAWPLAGYAALVAAYLAGTSALLATASKRKRIPDRVKVGDIILLGIATHKLTRIITKDWVTSPFRAPFTEYVRSVGGGEQTDKSRGSGLQRAVGDLITCPWCSGPWVGAALFGGLMFRPRATRLVAGMLASVAVSDYLHHAWEYTRAVAQAQQQSK